MTEEYWVPDSVTLRYGERYGWFESRSPEAREHVTCSHCCRGNRRVFACKTHYKKSKYPHQFYNEVLCDDCFHDAKVTYSDDYDVEINHEAYER